MHLLVALLALAAVSTAVPLQGHVSHEKRDYTSSQWIRRDRVPAHAVIPMRIGLAQRNLDDGANHLMDV